MFAHVICNFYIVDTLGKKRSRVTLQRPRALQNDLLLGAVLVLKRITYYTLDALDSLLAPWDALVGAQMESKTLPRAPRSKQKRDRNRRREETTNTEPWQTRSKAKEALE